MSRITVTGLVLANVKDYGAVGDGTTDDTVAIQAAIDDARAVGLGGIFIPPGTYGISVDGLFLTAVSNFRVVGAGRYVSTLQFLASDHGGVTTSILNLVGGCDSITIDDLGLDGNKANLTNATGTGGALLQTGDASNLEVTQVFFQNSPNHDVRGGGPTTSKNLAFREFRFLNNTGSGFQFSNIAELLIESGSVDQAPTVETMHFIEILSDPNNANIAIRGNHFVNSDNSWDGIVIESVDGCEILNNKVLGGADGANNGIRVIATVNGVFDLIIQGNQLSGTMTNSISIAPTTGNVGRVAIQDNKIDHTVTFLAGAGTITQLPVISNNSGPGGSPFGTANLIEPAFVIGGSSINSGFATAATASRFVGTGSPESAVSGQPGDTYYNAAGGAGTTFWIKETGAGTNTGWKAVPGAPTSTDQRIARFNGTAGAIQDSLLKLDNTGNVTPATTETQDLGSATLKFMRVQSRKGIFASQTTGTTTLAGAGLLFGHFGGVNQNNCSLVASGDGSFTGGNIGHTGALGATAILRTTTFGAFAFGMSYSNTVNSALLEATGIGSMAQGGVYGYTGAASMRAVGRGASATGYAYGSGGVAAILASGNGSFCHGFATGGETISATALNAIQFGVGTNAIASSLKVGIAGAGIRLRGTTSFATPVNGDIGVNVSGQLQVQSAGVTQVLSRPTITGSRAGNAALASLLSSLATMNLIVNSTTA